MLAAQERAEPREGNFGHGDEQMLTSSTCRRSGIARRRLTQRESEVAALIAQGLKNYSIARRLSLSPATVATYVQRIQSRLGVSGREHIATWVTTANGVTNARSREPYATFSRPLGARAGG
jgi:DNA-binding NarL/FixJ family response regulator